MMEMIFQWLGLGWGRVSIWKAIAALMNTWWWKMLERE
jgi:hypothetical protein